MAKAAKTSPFAPVAAARDAGPLPGVQAGGLRGRHPLRGPHRPDGGVLDAGHRRGGVLTRSKTCSAPVLWCRESLNHGKARALVVNSGNANAFTGKRGREATRMTAEAAAKAVGCEPREVFVASTGVIGEPLDAGKFAHLLDGLAKSAKPDAFEDRRPRDHDDGHLSQARDAHGRDRRRTEVTINGFCKGAGMIAPDMATMLCFIFTDAAIAPARCRRCSPRTRRRRSTA